MKVLLLSPIHVTGNAEGVTQNIRYILRGLQNLGVEASLLTPSQEPNVLGRPFSSVFRGLELARLLRQKHDRADLFHIHLQNPSQALLLKRVRMLRSRVILQIWDSYIEYDDVVQILQGQESSALLAEYLPHIVLNTRWTAGIALAGFETFVVSCRFMEQRIRRLGLRRSQIMLIPNGVNTNEYRQPHNSEREEVRGALKIGHERPVVLYYGHATRIRGVPHLFKSMALVAKVVPNVLLLIAESGRRTIDLQREIQEAGIEEKTLVLGHVNVPKILFAADIGVLPLASHLGAAMMPNTLLEMMAAGLPVVTTTVGALPEVVMDGRTGLLVKPCNPSQLASAIIRLLSDDGLCESLGKAARSVVKEKYEWTTSIQKLAKLYDGMCN